MDFQTILNNYINKINCSSKELANASKLSEATISRYCNGSRLPINPSEQLDKLIVGLGRLANNHKIVDLNENIIRQDFNSVLKHYEIEKIINNFNQLVSILKINISEFSKVLGYDASYLSKIRSGKRKPSDPEMLLDAISNYVVNNYNDDDNKQIISSLIGCDIKKVINNQGYKDELISWLCSDYKELESNNDINRFLSKLNDFDLNEYIRVIHFDELRVPTIPFKIPKSKHYYGIEEMKQGELDFFKSTVLSKSSDAVFMCSDMQMDDMSQDLNFGKKWMFGIAMMLKKGLHLDVIHNLDRPFKEMMIGLESWIPIYMTGQVSPYYLTNVQNSVYSHFNYVSNNVALTGECIKGYHNKGKYYLTNNKTEVAYFQEKKNCLLKKAHPLMNIYRDKDIPALNSFIDADTHIKGKRKRVSSTLPIYTISEENLIGILKHNHVSNKDIEIIISFVKKEKERMKTILHNSSVQDITTKISKSEFDKFPVSLELSGLLYPKKIIYSYGEYLEHFKNTKEYESLNNNYHFLLSKDIAFRNIKISIHFNKWVMISKIDDPVVHFVIKHPKLCKAIENFVVPITE